MTLENKIELVERARAESESFDIYFKELLASGLSHAGAYNAAAEKLTPKPEPKPVDKKPVSPTKKVTTATKTEKVNEQSSKS